MNGGAGNKVHGVGMAGSQALRVLRIQDRVVGRYGLQLFLNSSFKYCPVISHESCISLLVESLIDRNVLNLIVH